MELSKQQRIYFMLIDAVVEYSGYKKQEVHELLKSTILVPYFNLKSTTKIKDEETWKRYIAKCKEYIYLSLDIIV